jgi:enamine deaminase RidA (YjgF/YER057c/UK114 family)
VQASGFYCGYQSGEAPVIAAGPGCLATVIFDGQCRAPAQAGLISTGLRLLEPAGIRETLVTTDACVSDYSDNLYWAQSGELLFLAVWVDEGDDESLERLTEQAYSRLLSTMQQRGYPYMVRVWNYLADINAFEQQEERYRQFCVGRFDAFARHGVQDKDFPSACALGHSGGDLVIYLLASKHPPVHFENPQQVSAYHYPEEYGPRSPSFARASLLTLADGTDKLFVSGTASVVGHMTRHPGDVQGQLAVTLHNIDSLLAHVLASQSRGSEDRLAVEVLKIYLRHPADLAVVKAGVLQHFGDVPMVFVVADVCRSDLLLEIDGLWRLTS